VIEGPYTYSNMLYHTSESPKRSRIGLSEKEKVCVCLGIQCMHGSHVVNLSACPSLGQEEKKRWVVRVVVSNR
jgi:hypothetical protein